MFGNTLRRADHLQRPRHLQRRPHPPPGVRAVLRRRTLRPRPRVPRAARGAGQARSAARGRAAVGGGRRRDRATPRPEASPGRSPSPSAGAPRAAGRRSRQTPDRGRQRPLYHVTWATTPDGSTIDVRIASSRAPRRWIDEPVARGRSRGVRGALDRASGHDRWRDRGCVIGRRGIASSSACRVTVEPRAPSAAIRRLRGGGACRSVTDVDGRRMRGHPDPDVTDLHSSPTRDEGQPDG